MTVLESKYKGVWKIGNIEIPCFVIEKDNEVIRVITSKGLTTAIGMEKSRGNISVINKKKLQPFMSDSLRDRLANPIKFRGYGTSGRGGHIGNGYTADTLVDLCDVYLDAKDAGLLDTPKELNSAVCCRIVQRAFAKVGINAIIDEATGYQKDRASDSLQKILEAFIAKELLPWTKRFPDDFYKEIFRLKKWDYPITNRPSVLGHYTNDIVYSRIAPGVLNELKKSVPRTDNGNLVHHYHRKFTKDVGNPKLEQHINTLITIMRGFENWEDFYFFVNKTMPVVSTDLANS